MKERYRILRVIHSLRAETGGPVTGLAEATPVLAEAGIASEFAILDGCRPEAVPFSSCPVHVFQASNSYGSCPAFDQWLDAHIQNYDAVFVHGCWKYHGVAVRVAANKHKIPYYVYPHGMLDPWFNERYPLKRIKKQLYWWLREHAVIKDARAVLFTSKEEMRLASQAFYPYTARGLVINYGIRSPKNQEMDHGQAFLRQHEFNENLPYILYLGRIHEKKGIDLLIDCWNQWKTSKGMTSEVLQLIIVGPTGAESYETFIANKMSGCENVHRVGSVYGKTKWSALSGAIALILPSHQENFGIVVAEALSVGTPVFLTKQVNIWREVVESGAGYAADDTPKGIFQLLEKIECVAEPNADSKALSSNAISCYKKYFCIDGLADSFRRLLTHHDH